MAYHPTRKLTILALDPSVRTSGRILRAQIEVPNEVLEPGPRGYRVFIVDYDSSADAFRSPGQTFREPGDSEVPRQVLIEQLEKSSRFISSETAENAFCNQVTLDC